MNYFFRVQNCFWDVLIKIHTYFSVCHVYIELELLKVNKHNLKSIYHFLKEILYVSQKYLKYSSIFLLVWYKSQLTLKQEDVELGAIFILRKGKGVGGWYI